jgi:hypothetical protein
MAEILTKRWLLWLQLNLNKNVIAMAETPKKGGHYI